MPISVTSQMLNFAVFGYNLLFPNEANIDNFTSNHAIGTLLFKSSDDIDISLYSYISPFIKMSGIDCRYIGNREISEISEDDSWIFEVRDRLLLEWNPMKNEIKYRRWCSEDEFLFWILHTFLPFALEFSKRAYIFHSSGVEIKNRSILFIGESYSGKSTLLDAFVKRGFNMIADDSVGLIKRENKFYTISSYPFRRPYRKLRDIGIFTTQYSDGFYLLDAIFILNRVSSDISISLVSGVHKFKYLSDAIFVKRDISDLDRFKFILNLSQNSTLYILNIPNSIDKIDKVIDNILNHFKYISK